MTEIVLRARRTLKVLRADTFPRSTNSVTYLQQGRITHRTNTMTQHTQYHNTYETPQSPASPLNWEEDITQSLSNGRREREKRTEEGRDRSVKRKTASGALCWPWWMLDLPGITATVFKALSTLNVRRADTLPRFTNSVTYLQNGSQHSYQRERGEWNNGNEKRYRM